MALSKAELMESVASRVAWQGEVDGVGEVCIRDITDDDYEYVLRRESTTSEREMMARMVAVGLCDDEGEPIFTRKEAAHISKTFKFKAIKKLSSLVREHGMAEGEDGDDDPGNSNMTTPNDSGTD